MDYCNTSPQNIHCHTFYMTKKAILMTTISSILSILGSMLTFSIILRSQIKLSSIYHRIIFMTSIATILSATASLFTTLPMPLDTVYPFPQKGFLLLFPSSGNVTTCQLQGFAFILGTGTTFFYNCGLVLFYLCMIRFQMKEQKIRNVIEPIIHVISWMIPLVILIILLSQDLINPSPYSTFCNAARYPWNCEKYETTDCIRGGNFNFDMIQFLIFFIASVCILGFINVLVCMGLILQITLDRNSVPLSSTMRQETWKTAKKTISYQALMYIGVFLITWTFFVLRCFIRSPVVNALHCIFGSSSGFSNAIIFLYHKVHNTIRLNHDISVQNALYNVIIKPQSIAEFRVSELSNLRYGSRSIIRDKEKLYSINNDSNNMQPIVSFEDGLDDASKNVQISFVADTSSIEMQCMFDIHSNDNGDKMSNNMIMEEQCNNDQSHNDLSLFCQELRRPSDVGFIDSDDVLNL